MLNLKMLDIILTKILSQISYKNLVQLTMFLCQIHKILHVILIFNFDKCHLLYQLSCLLKWCICCINRKVLSSAIHGCNKYFLLKQQIIIYSDGYVIQVHILEHLCYTCIHMCMSECVCNQKHDEPLITILPIVMIILRDLFSRNTRRETLLNWAIAK